MGQPIDEAEELSLHVLTSPEVANGAALLAQKPRSIAVVVLEDNYAAQVEYYGFRLIPGNLTMAVSERQLEDEVSGEADASESFADSTHMCFCAC